MKLQKLVFALALLITMQAVQAQEDKKVLSFKVYLNGSYQELSNREYYSLSDYQPYNYTGSKYNFGGLSLALEIASDKFVSHEFELNPFNYSRNDNKLTYKNEYEGIRTGDISTTISSAFRYQVSHYFMSDRMINPYLALSGMIYYEYWTSEQYLSTSYNQYAHHLQFNLSLIPGVKVNVTDRFALVLDIPFQLYRIDHYSIDNGNPTLPLDIRVISNSGELFLPAEYCLRLGASFKI